ncbi:hypothetical protein ACGFX8_30620 [Streptomyces sp. NPDC048362]|uniref:hypothetical protein n=1 Tax=Streptomyces sp. NPDC048362 TaxID=3365539 RepID=UPI00371DB52A
MQEFPQGSRVEYQDKSGNSHSGKIERMAGSGEDTLYTISNDATGQKDEVAHAQIERRLQ